jgi:hypothetical protein
MREDSIKPSPLNLAKLQLSAWSFPFICSLQKLLVVILSDEFQLLSVLLVFPAFLAPKPAQNPAWVVWAIGASLQSSFSKTADLNFAFSLAQVSLA